MANLIYTAITSLDGYVADTDGKWDWSRPDPEVHAAVNELEAATGTHLYGRRLYEVLVAWETLESDVPELRDYARIWQAADKIVYSRTLESVSSARTRIERAFDPAVVRELRASSDSDISVGGPHLAAEAIRAGLVDEILLFLNPIVVGCGNAALPDDVHMELELLDDHRFTNGVVYVRYGVRTTA
jgi:dihydrofolate reductase